MILQFLVAVAAATTPAPAFATAPCSARESARATVTQIAGNPDRYLGRCVTVAGALAGTSMYSGREVIYRPPSCGRDGNFPPANLAHRIGIDNQQIRELQLRHPL